MRSFTTLAVAAGAALVLIPATVSADPPAGKGPNKPAQSVTGATGPTGSTGATGQRGNAYGRRCRGVSKKHVKGQKGTPFSQCVKALKALDEGKASSPAKACKAVSRKKVAGQKKTPYSMCVRAAAKMQGES